jgi:predicted nucleic acid-binding protein
MAGADAWYICRPGFVETVRAVGLAAGRRATRAVTDEWPAFAVIEVDQRLGEHAAALALDHTLRSLDAIHLAAALVVPGEDLALATWDRRLHGAARTERLELVPSALS